jgi:glyoxylate reductase
VSLHLRNTPEVRGLVGARELALMKPSAYLINTARGALVDSSALASVLRAGQIAGAALDVYTEEPLLPERNPFLDLDNVILTPHIGAVTREANARSRAMPVDNIITFLEGQPQNVVNG